MEDQQSWKLVELLTRYGQDYPDTVEDDVTVREVIHDLLESSVPVSKRELAAHHDACKTWLSKKVK